MLQQTRVATVLRYYEPFLARFPDARALARARLASVLAAWSGLGYYRRARHLHAAARAIARSGPPTDAAGWRALPGVGAYTAAAVASIAFGERAAVVDGNVARVVSRLLALERDPRAVRAFAEAWVDARAPGDHNQAVMELGATICRPRAPLCSECPLRRDCAGRASPERYPAPRRRASLPLETRDVAFVTRGGRVLLRRRREGERLGGLWDLPDAPARGPLLGEVRHALYDRRLLLRIREGRAPGGGRWFDPGRAAALPLAGAARKCLARVGFLPDS